MTWLKNIGHDLVEKRLWPFALAFAILIVAMPVLLTRGGGSEDVGAPVASAASAAGMRKAVVVIADDGDGPARGKLRNPFFAPPKSADPAAASETKDGAAASGTMPSGTADVGKDSGGSGSGTGSGSGSGSGSGDSGSGSDSTKSTSKGSGENGYDVTLRFGPSDTTRTTIKDIPRLTPLPDVNNPYFVFLGVLANGRTAVFMVGTDMNGAVGDGTCRPSTTNCETLELDEGETEFLDVTAADGTATQYQLDIVSVTKRGKGGATVSSSEEKASASAAKAGRKAVRAARKDGAADTLDGYRYDTSDGVIRRLTTKQRKRLRARASAASVLRVHRTGRVVAGGLDLG